MLPFRGPYSGRRCRRFRTPFRSRGRTRRRIGPRCPRMPVRPGRRRPHRRSRAERSRNRRRGDRCTRPNERGRGQARSGMTRYASPVHAGTRRKSHRRSRDRTSNEQVRADSDPQRPDRERDGAHDRDHLPASRRVEPCLITAQSARIAMVTKRARGIDGHDSGDVFITDLATSARRSTTCGSGCASGFCSPHGPP